MSTDAPSHEERTSALLGRLELASPPRFPLAQLPTRTERLSRLSDELGIDLWVKRDDETGTELSGNKIRKLEYLLAEASGERADIVLTCGGVQSNHCRATSLAARRVGMDSVVYLRGTEPAVITGNLLLDRLVGAEVRYITPGQYAERAVLLQEAAEKLRAGGRRPYVIPEGGSSALGSWGYVRFVAELASATKESTESVAELAPATEAPAEPGAPSWDHIVCATGSGGTLAGLVLGRRLLAPLTPWLHATRMWGVPVCDDGAYFRRKVLEIAREFTDQFEGPASRSRSEESGRSPIEQPALIDEHEIGILDGYKGPAYAVPYDEEVALIQQVARMDGLFLDPVYTGKAFYGMVNEARNGRFRPGERVLFLHTGGIFSLFAYADELLA